MSWEKVRLGDIAEFSNGINFGKDDYGKGIKIIGCQILEINSHQNMILLQK